MALVSQRGMTKEQLARLKRMSRSQEKNSLMRMFSRLPDPFTSILQNWYKFAGREAYCGTVTHIVAGESNKIDQKQHEEGEKRLAAAIWGTNLNRCQDMIQKGS